MAKHIVKCKYCGEQFDANQIEYVKISTRYAHKSCCENNNSTTNIEKTDKEQLDDYINKLFGKNANWAMIKKQIKNYIEEYKYSYSGILKTLIYWYDILHNSSEKSNGAIGIVPFIYNQAYNYWYELYVAKNINENKDLNKYKENIKEITIRLPIREAKKIKLFNLEDGE